MKKVFTFPMSVLLVFASVCLFSCAKENLSNSSRGGGGASNPSGGGNPNSGVANTITSNFNGTPIPSGNDVWFNAHVKLNGNISNGTVININEAFITIPSGQGTLYVPNAVITVSNTFATQTASYDGMTWHINVPLSQSNKNIFMTGMIYTSTGLAGGLNPVDFTASFYSNHPGVTLDWQWSAAVYNTSMSYGLLNVTPVDAAGTQAGAPNGYNGHAVGGARGGGAADLTGSWSGTGHVSNLPNGD